MLDISNKALSNVVFFFLHEVLHDHFKSFLVLKFARYICRDLSSVGQIRVECTMFFNVVRHHLLDLVQVH